VQGEASGSIIVALFDKRMNEMYFLEGDNDKNN